MKKEQKWVEINGEQVMDLTPDHERQLALVDLGVLTRLTDFLPKSNLYDIVENHVTDVRGVHNIQEFVDMLAEELAFHQTVNLIQEYKPNQPNVVGKIDLEDDSSY